MVVIGIHKKSCSITQVNQVDSIELIGENQDVILVHGVLATQTTVSNWQFPRADWIVRIIES